MLNLLYSLRSTLGSVALFPIQKPPRPLLAFLMPGTVILFDVKEKLLTSSTTGFWSRSWVHITTLKLSSHGLPTFSPHANSVLN